MDDNSKPEKVDRRRKKEGTQRTFKIMVRFSPNVKAVVEDAWKRSGRPTLSEYVRWCVWEMSKPEGDKSQA